MGDQGKRLMLAVGLALAFMLGWQMLMGEKEKPKPAPGAPGAPAAAVQIKPTSKVGAPRDTTTPEAPKGSEQKILLEYPGKFTATFSDHGGVLYSFKLHDSKFQRDATKGEMLPALPGTGAFFVDFVDLENAKQQRRPRYFVEPDAKWVGTRVSDTEVRYRTDTPTVAIEKIFTIVPDAYFVKMSVKVSLKTPAGVEVTQNIAVTSYGYQNPKVDLEDSQQVAARAWSSAVRVEGDEELSYANVKQVVEWPRVAENIRWTGYDHPYMLAGYAPRKLPNERVTKFTFAVQAEGLMRTDIVLGAQKFKAGDPVTTREVAAYFGPKQYNTLDLAETSAEFSTGFTDTIDFGWFGVIGRPLLWLLKKFYALFGNWGIAIMLLTVLVKAATLYWTTKSMRSMKAMAALAPQMKLLQQKYEGDRQRLQAETMALYKQHNVNPIAGCLPILLQMPIWIALYRMLSSAGELYLEPFIPGWIDDLTATDPYYVLPIVLMATMFVQARLTPATGDSRQQKFIMYGMPLMFGVMSFFFPSGLTLYIFTNTVLSALHSIYMNKYDKKSKAVVAQMKKNVEEAAAAAAKAAGGTKAKNGASATKAKAPVIDVEATEVRDGDDDDEAESTESSAATAAGGGSSTSSTSGPGARPRKRKKRRR